MLQADADVLLKALGHQLTGLIVERDGRDGLLPVAVHRDERSAEGNRLAQNFRIRDAGQFSLELLPDGVPSPREADRHDFRLVRCRCNDVAQLGEPELRSIF